MEACLNGAHHLHRALDQGQRGANRSFLLHVCQLEIGQGSEPPALIHDLSEHLMQYVARFLIGHERDVVLDRATRHINITELTRHDG